MTVDEALDFADNSGGAGDNFRMAMITLAAEVRINRRKGPAPFLDNPTIDKDNKALISLLSLSAHMFSGPDLLARFLLETWEDEKVTWLIELLTTGIKEPSQL